MEQGTSYLYEYNNGRPVRCTGFIHVTEHYHSCILQLRTTQIPAADDDPFDLSAFRLTEDGVAISQISTVVCCREEISARLSVSERDFPDQCTLADIDGFLIRKADDPPYTAGPSVFWVAADPLPPADVFSALSPGHNTDTTEDRSVQDAVPPENAPEKKPSADLGSAEKKSEIQARKIKRSDLTLLPRRFWHLANNSFLLHGYHNYSHLLLLEENGRLWLGVPGIYDPREARAADLFGFPRFTREAVPALDLEETEQSTDEHFGHWCRCVR